MQPTKLHIVSFDVPYPADYGGAIDVFYKIKSLAAAGVEIYLHCFQYGREVAKELENYCTAVYYYDRTTGISSLLSSLPYIVYSRRDEMLLERLLEVDAPILFEGIHTTYYLSHPSLKGRFKIVRNHNVEYDYYHQLYKKEPSLIKKLFFKREATLLKKYEAALQDANALLPLSSADADLFGKLYSDISCQFIAPFHAYNEVNIKEGMGSFCLYHGNLSHPENREAAMFLLRQVIPHSAIPFIIAGRNPSADILAACQALENCQLIENPEEQEMNELIADAHIHILPTFQATGMKLKLLYALFSGRHVLVNNTMLHGTGLDNCCEIANTPDEMIAAIAQLKDTPLTQKNIAARAQELSLQYNNTINAQKILTLLRN